LKLEVANCDLKIPVDNQLLFKVTNCDLDETRWSQIVTSSRSMSETTSLIPVERIEQAILLIRGEKVMLDIDLAVIYGVTTKRLNEQVKRNAGRFPPDFMFQLIETEKAEVVANCDHLARLKFSPHLPYAFTEHGALMLANVLNSERAAQTSVMVVRAFVKLRRMRPRTPNCPASWKHWRRNMTRNSRLCSTPSGS
jgi:hypothetical protein